VYLLQKKSGGRNKELKEAETAKAGEGPADKGKSGGAVSPGEDQTGSIRFDTETGRRTSIAKRGTLKKSKASAPHSLMLLTRVVPQDKLD